MISSKLMLKPELNTHLQPISVVVGSPNNFKGIPEASDHIQRPLMVNAWSQTSSIDFSILKEIENRHYQSQREKELEEKIRVLEENLKAHSELLSQIHATSAKTSVLLGQQQYINNVHINTNCGNTTTPQTSPKVVNAINTIQQVSCSPNESVKYTIIAEGRGNHNEEPIEIQLAEDDGALNLNSSADSGRLEICLAPEENVEIKTEYNTSHNTMTAQYQGGTPTIDATHSEHHFIKKRKLAAEQHELLTQNLKSEQIVSFNNVQQKLPNQNRRSSGNSLLKSQKKQNNSNNCSINIQTPTNQNMVHSPTTSNNSSHKSIGGEPCQVSVDAKNVMVSIGPNNTCIPAKLYENMNWSSASIATRKLLMAVFDRKILATHSMTGKPSPAFKDHGKPIKQMLEPLIIADIIFAVTHKCNVSDKEVRNAITTKCADENKMMKLQMNKRTPMKEMNKENLVG